MATERFDHTSPLRLLELLTGVKAPNLSAWRRSTFGDLTSALGVASITSPPALPDTKAQLAEAEKEVETPAAADAAGQDPDPAQAGDRHDPASAYLGRSTERVRFATLVGGLRLQRYR